MFALTVSEWSHTALCTAWQRFAYVHVFMQNECVLSGWAVSRGPSGSHGSSLDPLLPLFPFSRLSHPCLSANSSAASLSGCALSV